MLNPLGKVAAVAAVKVAVAVGFLNPRVAVVAVNH